MSARSSDRRSDKSLYNECVQDYIPLACHYDSTTLLTKNGELLQVLEITGMSSEKVENNLDTLTSLVRGSLAKNISDQNTACWINTIRRKQNIDDPHPYDNFFSGNLHKAWADKYDLKRRFVNVLYITVVVRGMGGNIKSIDGFVSSTTTNTVISKHEKFLVGAAEKLYNITNNILTDLQTFGASRLKIRHTEDKSFSDPIYLFSHLSSFNENSIEVPLSDLSSVLSVDKYAVGSRQIEVVHKGKTHFASILSLREYHHSNQDDLFGAALQLPVEMISTEIFYPIPRKEAEKDYKHQDYILGVTGDSQLRVAKGLDILMDESRDVGYIRQQLSITIIAEDVASLEKNTKKASKYLSSIGVVHVREDINLENIFWSQLPANFQYVRRSIGAVEDNIGAFASLQSTPHGRKVSKWGKFVTVMPCINGTPYFANFHSEKNTGHSCFFGNKGSGKTSLMNFLVSEAMKYKPTIIYISPDKNPKLFVNAIGGTWYDEPKLPVVDDIAYASLVAGVMSGKYTGHLLPGGMAKIEELVPLLQNAKDYPEMGSIIENFELGDEARNLKARMGEVTHFFKENNIKIEKGSITGICLDSVRGKENQDIKAAIVFAALRALGVDKESPKMLIMDEMAVMLDHPYFTQNIDLCYQLASIYNISMLGAVDTERYTNVTERKLWDSVDQMSDLKVVMPHDNIAYDLREIFNLTDEENDSLAKTQSDSVFILKPHKRRSTILNFNNSGLENHMRVLYGADADIELMEKAKAEKGNNVEDWLPYLYELMEK